MALQVGQIYGGKYRVLRVLGEGFAGAVYEGENVEQHRRVALETLSAELGKYPEALTRFQKEAEALRKLDAEHVGKVQGTAELPDGSRFLIREYLEGMTLEQRLRERGRLDADEASRIGLEVAQGLAAAHEVGVSHRGIGPASVFLARTSNAQPEKVKLLAFGLFLPKDDYECGPSHYAAPEQIKGNVEVDGRADVYAAGVVLYESLAGQVPFSTSSADDLVFQIVMRDPTPLEKIAPDVDPELCTIVHKAMARDVRVRYQSARELAQALSSFRARRGLGAAPSPTNPASRNAPSAAMSAPDDDDDHDLGDHGTVVMNRKLPFIPTNAAARPLPAPPAPPAPHALPVPPPPSMTNQALPSGIVPSAPGSQAAPGLPVVPPSITGISPSPAARPAPGPEKLAPIVAGAAFGIVFVLGTMIMLIIRMVRGPAEEDPSAMPAASASALSAPTQVAPPQPMPAVSGTAGTDTTTSPATTTTATQKSTPSRTSPGPRTTGGKRRISNDL